jgi:hypothetical protein
MQVRVDDPALEAQIQRWMSETGRGANELVEDAIAAYFSEVSEVREMLGRRYNEMKSGKLGLIAGEQARVIAAVLRSRA